MAIIWLILVFLLTESASYFSHCQNIPNKAHFKQPNTFPLTFEKLVCSWEMFQLQELKAVGEGGLIMCPGLWSAQWRNSRSAYKRLNLEVPRMPSLLQPPSFCFSVPPKPLWFLPVHLNVLTWSFLLPEFSLHTPFLVHGHLWSPLEIGCTHRRLVQHLMWPQLPHTPYLEIYEMD